MRENMSTPTKPFRGIPYGQWFNVQWQMPTQILDFRAATGYAFTIFLAGFALTITTLPNTSRFPAFVAGLVRVFSLHKPGSANTPVFFTSCVATSARTLSAFAQTDFFNSQDAAIASAIAPLVMALDVVAFFIGAMLCKKITQRTVTMTREYP